MALLVSVAISAAASQLHAVHALGTAHREQDQVVIAAGIRVADFTSIPQNPSDLVEFTVLEDELEGTVTAGVPDDAAPYGVQPLGPLGIEQLVLAVETELDTVPASAATRTPIIKLPGFALRGRSMGDSAGPQQHSIPTVFAPFYAGTIFQLDGVETPPGVVLNFYNMTLLLPDVTYQGIYQSGLLDFFDIGRSARFCFTNSVLVLKSCDGYVPNTYHMWCCTARQCNILYTEQALTDLGYETIGPLAHITCYERQAEPDLEPEPPAEEETGETVAVGIRVADFSTLPQNLTAEVEFSVPEIQLDSSVTVLAAGDDSVPYGTYALSPAAVEELELAFDTELGLVPASAASPAPIVGFPGVALRGESVLDTLSTQQPRRIPTVFAPFHAGTIFQVDGRDTPPGVTLNFSNMTLFMPDATYEDIYTSGLMDYFQLGRSARFCFTNSVLVLKSCDGYVPNIYHMWCCTARQCNILYTQQAIEDLGYETIDDLEYIGCYSKEASGSEDLTNVAAAPDGAVPVLDGGPGSPVLGVAAPEAGVIEVSSARKCTVSERFMHVPAFMVVVVMASFLL